MCHNFHCITVVKKLKQIRVSEIFNLLKLLLTIRNNACT